MSQDVSEIVPPKRERLLCLDAFRGFDIAAMLFVNMTWNREVFHWQLFHIDWNAPEQGATFTDLVFPWFLFIAGAAIPLSMKSGRGRSMSTLAKVAAAARRGLVIYLLGVLLTVAGSAYDRPLTWTDWFSWNILQLIGAGYFVAVCIYLMPRWAQVAAVVAILLAKLALPLVISAEYARGVMQAASMAPRVAGGEFTGPGTFTHFDDIKRLLHLEHTKATLRAEGEPRLWAFGIGWFGMAQQYLPLAAVAVMGGWCIELLTSDRHAKLRRAGLLFAAGVAATSLAYLLQAGYDPAGGGWLGPLTQPFSKWIFTPSYCLLAAGTGAMLLSGVYLVTDVWKVGTLFVLRVYGLNALALYMGAEFTFKTIFAKWQIIHPNGHSGAMAGGLINWMTHWAALLGAGQWAAAAWGGWVFVLTWLATWWLFCWWLWRRRIVIRV
jgi:predicted acyltransferase